MAKRDRRVMGQANTLAEPVLDLATMSPDEQALLRSAELNNRRFVAQMKNHLVGPFWWSLPGSVYDKSMLRDAWGTPLVFMPGQHPAIGMALGNKPFFFSAGPDRKFRTLEDNLYSYEQGTSAARGE